MRTNEASTVIARDCPEFATILEAQGYGISFANTAAAAEEANCEFCVNWQGGSCDIYRSRLD